MISDIKISKHKGWGICAKYSDGVLTVCRYGKTPQDAKNRVLNRVNEYYGRKG